MSMSDSKETFNDDSRANGPQGWNCDRGRVLAVALAVLVTAGIMVAAFVLVVRRQQEARRAETERFVAEALREAEQLQAYHQWPYALSAAKRAQGLLAGNPTSENLRQQTT